MAIQLRSVQNTSSSRLRATAVVLFQPPLTWNIFFVHLASPKHFFPTNRACRLASHMSQLLSTQTTFTHLPP
ncbi:unnamed protein product [Brassica oleracea var. botrytis]|uniref:(rape) hypothetical protein n=1 Tax=Brassica napus TaxID=3708 RepID=A0A816QXE1_BRANA|nr:unnamed protein product [Brassica napus]